MILTTLLSAAFNTAPTVETKKIEEETKNTEEETKINDEEQKNNEEA